MLGQKKYRSNDQIIYKTFLCTFCHHLFYTDRNNPCHFQFIPVTSVLYHKAIDKRFNDSHVHIPTTIQSGAICYVKVIIFVQTPHSIPSVTYIHTINVLYLRAPLITIHHSPSPPMLVCWWLAHASRSTIRFAHVSHLFTTCNLAMVCATNRTTDSDCSKPCQCQPSYEQPLNAASKRKQSRAKNVKNCAPQIESTDNRQNEHHTGYATSRSTESQMDDTLLYDFLI